MAEEPQAPYSDYRLFGPRGFGRTYLAVLGFLIAFFVVLLIVSRWYLMPAFAAATHATEPEKKALSAQAWLVLCVLLFVLFVGLAMTFRVSRFFFPRSPAPPSKPTKYVDAWAESGKRMEMPPDELDEA